MPRLQQTVSEALATALASHRAGRLEEAEAIYRQVLAQVPEQFDAIHLLGLIAHQRGNHPAALREIARAISINDQSADAHSNLGLVHRAMGNTSAALACQMRAVKLDPDQFQAHIQLGDLLAEHGKFDQAIACHRRAVELNPSSAAAQNNLGNSLRSRGLLNESAGAYRRAIEIDASFATGFTNLGMVLSELQQYAEAIECCRRALALEPDSAPTLNTLGTALKGLGRLDEAVAAYKEAIRLNPNLAEAYNNQSVALMDQGNAVEAVKACERALAIWPHYLKAHSNLIFTRIYSALDDGHALFAEQQRFNHIHGLPLGAAIAPHTNDRSPQRRLRIGYVSPNFREHCQSLYTIPLLSHHDHEQFEIFCYAHTAFPDQVTLRLKGCADQWRDTTRMSDEEIADLIRRDRIDILVDLTMHMSDNRILVFARKPAPVQACWLAYPGSTGLATMDYRISDPHLDPPALNDHPYSERTIRLPDAFWCYDPLENETVVGPAPVLKNRYITFGCLNNFCKVNDAVLVLWARVLNAVPESRLVILAIEGSHRERTLKRLADMGISEERIGFLSHAPRSSYLRYYDHIDIALDTVPSNGHTTSLDAYWMGVPVVTLVGRTVSGRAGLCQLTLLGLPDLIAQDADQYVQIAKALASDLPRITQMRATLRDRLRTSALMDAPRFARNMESAYRRMWQQWCDPQAPITLGSTPGGMPSVEIPLDIINQHIAPVRWNPAESAPRVSCLMVTRDRPAQARMAVECFIAQRYSNKELLIVSEHFDPAFTDWIAGLRPLDIRVLTLERPMASLGEIRNYAVQQASGELVCQWDDDDLFDPDRLSVQVSLLMRSGAHACVMQRWMIWWPHEQRLAISTRRHWEGSLIALKSIMPSYAPAAIGEDTPVIDHLLKHRRIVTFDLPWLYIYVAHGGNTFAAAHFQNQWAAAAAWCEGMPYVQQLARLAERLPPGALLLSEKPSPDEFPIPKPC